MREEIYTDWELIDVSSFADIIHKRAKEKGFWDTPFNLGEKLMLITSELGEALEADRNDKYADVDLFYSEVEHKGLKEAFEISIKDTLEDELADVFIRLLDLAAGLEINIDWHIKKKMEYNRLRSMLHEKKY